MSIAIIALEYLEPEYIKTVNSIKECGLPVFYAKRDGVGNMSRAFNDAFKKYVENAGFEFVWFITNITFEKDVPGILAGALESDRALAAVHPVMDNSDHQHLWNGHTGIARTVPFIEFTAPMFRSSYFSKFMLDENLWYYYMDLEICYRMRQSGFGVAVHDKAEIGHVYLRHSKSHHQISAIRKQLREYISPLNKAYLTSKYREQWPQLFGWKE